MNTDLRNVPQELRHPLKNGYNGDLSSREAGSVGGQMVKNVCPIRTARFTRKNRIMEGHMQAVRYIVRISV